MDFSELTPEERFQGVDAFSGKVIIPDTSSIDLLLAETLSNTHEELSQKRALLTALIMTKGIDGTADGFTPTQVVNYLNSQGIAESEGGTNIIAYLKNRFGYVSKD